MVVTTALPGYSFAFSPIPPAQASATAWLERAKAVYGDQSKIFLLPQRSPYPSVFPPHPLAPPALIDPYLLQQSPKKNPISNQVTLQQVSHNLQQQQQQTKSPHETQQLNLPFHLLLIHSDMIVHPFKAHLLHFLQYSHHHHCHRHHRRLDYHSPLDYRQITVITAV
ncbi:unnamed protein product [Rhizopus microsporus]